MGEDQQGPEPYLGAAQETWGTPAPTRPQADVQEQGEMLESPSQRCFYSGLCQ